MVADFAIFSIFLQGFAKTGLVISAKVQTQTFSEIVPRSN